MTRIDMIASFWSYEYSRIMIWHGLNFEHFKNLEDLEDLEDLENLKNLDNWVLWLVALGAFYRAILDSILLSLVLSRNYWSSLASIWEKSISILVGNLNSVPSYLITAVQDTTMNFSLARSRVHNIRPFEGNVLLL